MVIYIVATVCLFTVLMCDEVTEIINDKSELSAIASIVIYLRILQLLLWLLCSSLVGFHWVCVSELGVWGWGWEDAM